MDFSNIDVKKGSLGSLANALGKTRFAKTDYSKDDEWSITRDKDGNGSAKIRFVPSPDGELFVEVRSHGFKYEGKWYIENCPKTMGWEEGCPCCENADAMKRGMDWDKIDKQDQDRIRPRFAKTSYWANILVEKDPENPENEGKVFKYRFGKKILEKIALRAQDDPLDESIVGVNAFDPIDGCSLKLVVKKVSGFPNYDNSSWAEPSKLMKGNSKKIEELINSGHEIGWMRTEKNFKEYSELAKKLAYVLGEANVTETAEEIDETSSDESSYEDNFKDTTMEENNTQADDEDDDAFNYFKSLSDESID